MGWKENVKIIFDESKEKTREEEAMMIKVLMLTLYPFGILVAFAMIWFLVWEQMTLYYWFAAVSAFASPGIGFYMRYRKLKQPEEK